MNNARPWHHHNNTSNHVLYLVANNSKGGELLINFLNKHTAIRVIIRACGLLTLFMGIYSIFVLTLTGGA